MKGLGLRVKGKGQVSTLNSADDDDDDENVDSNDSSIIINRKDNEWIC